MSLVKLLPSSREAAVSVPMLPFMSMKNQSPQAPDLFLAIFTNTLRAGAWGIRHLNSRALAGGPRDRSTHEHSTQKEMNPYKPPKLSEHRRLSLCTVHQLPVTVLHRVTRGRQSERTRARVNGTNRNKRTQDTYLHPTGSKVQQTGGVWVRNRAKRTMHLSETDTNLR